MTPPPATANGPYKTFFLLEEGKAVPCGEAEATIIAYHQPGPTEQQEMHATYGIDYHTLQSSLDHDEISRLEFEPDHAALIFKRPRSFCADDNFLLKITSTGVFLYPGRLVVVMPDDAPLFEGRVPFPMNNLQQVILRLLYQSMWHFEGHLKAINMLSDSLEKRLTTSMENRYLLNMFALEKSLVYIVNSLDSNGALFDKMKLNATRLDLDRNELGILDDIIIENQQSSRRASIYAEVIGSMMDARASLVNNNLNQLIKKLTIVMLAVMLPTLIIGIFSMNVELPFRDENEWWVFWLVCLLAFLPSGMVLWLWRTQKW